MATEAIYNKAETGLPFSMAVSTLHPSPEPKVNPERAEKRLEPQGGLGTGETWDQGKGGEKELETLG